MITLVGGRAGEGKTQFARFCMESLIEDNHSSVIVPFAYMVKETAFFMGWDGKKDDKGRKLLQEIGNVGREYNLNIWADHAVKYIVELAGVIPFVFIDDWRFPNEGKVLQEHFTPTNRVRMRRPEKFHALRETPLYNDVSEISLPDEDDYYDYIIQNDGDLDELKDLADDFVSSILLKR